MDQMEEYTGKANLSWLNIKSSEKSLMFRWRIFPFPTKDNDPELQ
jgi:hypothetical protein